MFNDAALKFDKIIEEGQVYVIKNGKVRISKKNNLHQFPMSITSHLTLIRSFKSRKIINNLIKSIEFNIISRS